MVEARAPEGEILPEPREHERVAFGAHFIVGFGMPIMSIFKNFLVSYSLQMHHLGVNAVMYVTYYVALCEGYQGFRPFVSFFRHFLYFRSQKHKIDKSPYSCGGVVVYRRIGLPFPQMTFKESYKKW
ncbi:hypothetical protein D1007_56794 [Hordeum vulgare]|nr:hypothetical protein D1007_56794 [Hordeum vulgare]